MIKKLQQAKAEFEQLKYKKPAMPEVLAYLKEAKKRVEGKTVYNSELTAEIMRAESLDEEWRDYINTEVYLAQQDYTAEREAELDAKMEAEGWHKLSEVGDYRGSAYLRAKREVDWLTQNIDIEGKIITDSGGRPFFIPKGRRSRGYNLVGTLKG